ncbi:unnamed protein product, partial [Adineta ricciae]
RVQLDPNGSFEQLVEQVRDRCLSILEHSHYPLQHIIGSHHAPAFLETMFDFVTDDTNIEQVHLGGTVLQSISADLFGHIAKFDMMITFVHSQSTGISCSLVCSQDLFDHATVQLMADRFSCLLHHLFNSALFSIEKQPLHQLSLILPHEQLLIDAMKNNDSHRPPSTDQTISQLFCEKASSYSQKVAVDLDEQCITYSELLVYTQQLAVVLIDTHGVKVGDIVCQCVERSLSMVIGIMAIEMVGAVYCPLSPQDPLHRLHTLVEQTNSRLVLVHAFTREIFDGHHAILDMDLVLNMSSGVSDSDWDRLSHIAVNYESIAYILFTSGSTGTPKAAQFRHRNFIEWTRSFVEMGIFNDNDTVVQLARCSFDIHLEEMVGIFIVGGTVVLLNPKGVMDLAYFIDVLVWKQITYFNCVPSFLTALCIYLDTRVGDRCLDRVRSLCCGGEPFPIPLVQRLQKHLSPASSLVNQCRIWNIYGPAETTIACIIHPINVTCEQICMPIGKLIPGYQCVIVDEYLQPVTFGQQGELFVAGVGIFAGYLGRDSLTQKALIDINGQLFYRTGDLVRLDNDGLLYYVGRKDHQIKLRGQRLEPGEIERCVLEASSLITSCVVVKWGDDHLVAYVQSDEINEKELRKHCESHLPSYMVPSLFIVLKQLPLNANGKVDRQLLPTPDFSTLLSSSSSDVNYDQSAEPNNELEARIHSLWCELLGLTRIPTTASIFSVGGHSLLLMQLYHRYKTMFDFDTQALTMAQLFKHASIIDHARLLAQSLNVEQYHREQWLPLNITQGRLSFAQERIFLDEQVRLMSKDKNVYAVPLVYRLSCALSRLSISRLRRALHSLITKHSILRTKISTDTNGDLIQTVLA